MTDETTTATEQTATETTIPVSRAALALHNLAAKEESRPLLAHVWTKGGRFTSADGYIAGMVKPAEEAAPPDGILLPRQAALSATAKTSAKTRGAAILRTEQGGEITTEAKPYERITFQQPGDVDGSLDIAALRHKDAPHAATAVNIDNLKKVTAFFSTAMAGTDGIVEMRVWSPQKALEFRGRSAEGEELTAILMPMAIGGYGSAGGSGPWQFDPVEGVDDRSKLLDHHIQQAIKGGAAGSHEDRVGAASRYLATLGFAPETISAVADVLDAGAALHAFDGVEGKAVAD